MVLLLLVILAPIKTPVISDSSSNYYPINVVRNEEYLVDVINPAEALNFTSYQTTYNNIQLVNQLLITDGIGSLEEDGYVSYFDNNYPYKIVNITDINNINSVEDLVNIIKKSKVFMLVSKSYSYWMQYDSETKKLTIHTYLVVNSHIISSTDLGYYDYLHSVPPDNSPTRVALLVTPFSGVLHPEHWKDYYEQKYGKQVYEVETDPPVRGLYSIDISIVFDFYPIVIHDVLGDEHYFAPGEFPRLYYDSINISITDSILDYPSILVNFIHIFFTGSDCINSGATVEHAYYTVMADNGQFAVSPSTSFAYEILSGSYLSNYGYGGHYRVSIVYGVTGTNAPLLIQGTGSGGGNGDTGSGDNGGGSGSGNNGGGSGDDGGGGGMICPPGSTSCNLPTSKNLLPGRSLAKW